MKKKIFRNMCLIALVAILLSSVMSTVVYYNRLEAQMKREVITAARYLQSGLELSGIEYLTRLEGRFKSGGQNRITLVAPDGTVLYDNYAQGGGMENHGDRPEVMNALNYGSGETTRISETLAEKTYYYALRLQDGTVIRVANTTKSVLSSVLQMFPFMGLLAAAVMALSMVLAERQTKRIVKPINDLDLDHPEENHIYDELAPLVGKVERQQRTIRSQMDTLKEKQKEFTAITENMSEGFIVVGKKSEVVSYNSSALKILGVEGPYVKEPGASILNFNRSQVFRKAVEDALEGLHKEHTMELAGRSYQVIANPVMDGKEVGGAIIVILDVTEKQEREELRREFSANVSHELKTPLTSISGYAEIMKNGLVKPEDMKRFSENIYQEAQRMITLIGDIIRLSQLDENQVDLKKSPVDLYQTASAVTARLKDQAEAMGVKLELTGEPVTVNGTAQILDEMIYNLCDNGIKYNKEGGTVTVRVGRGSGRERGPESGRPFIEVSDTGIGIPAEDKDRVFERFYRVDKSHSRQIGGTGLGLSIVKHGAIYHNAQVEMESAKGQGTTVKIVF